MRSVCHIPSNFTTDWQSKCNGTDSVYTAKPLLELDVWSQVIAYWFLGQFQNGRDDYYLDQNLTKHLLCCQPSIRTCYPWKLILTITKRLFLALASLIKICCSNTPYSVMNSMNRIFFYLCCSIDQNVIIVIDQHKKGKIWAIILQTESIKWTKFKKMF